MCCGTQNCHHTLSSRIISIVSIRTKLDTRSIGCMGEVSFRTGTNTSECQEISKGARGTLTDTSWRCFLGIGEQKRTIRYTFPISRISKVVRRTGCHTGLRVLISERTISSRTNFNTQIVSVFCVSRRGERTLGNTFPFLFVSISSFRTRCCTLSFVFGNEVKLWRCWTVSNAFKSEIILVVVVRTCTNTLSCRIIRILIFRRTILHTSIS